MPITVQTAGNSDGLSYGDLGSVMEFRIPSAAATNSLLLETADHILLENGDTLQLES